MPRVNIKRCDCITSINVHVDDQPDGRKTTYSVKAKSIAQIEIGSYSIYAFPGGLSRKDILVKYTGPYNPSRKRTPQHIHWLIDLLLKKQKEAVQADSFLRKCKQFWNEEATEISDNTFEKVKALIDKYINNDDYFGLGDPTLQQPVIGEFSLTFLACLFVLLATEEMTNSHNQAYMFGNVIDELLKPMNNLDIAGAVNIANFGGKK